MNTEISVIGLEMPVITIENAALKTREQALSRSSQIVQVTNAEEQKEAVEILGQLKSLERRMESSRELVKRPALDIGKKIDITAKEFSIPLQAESKRVSAIISDFQKQEYIRAEKLRQEETEKRRKLMEDEDLKKSQIEAEAQKATNAVDQMVVLQKLDVVQEQTATAIQESVKTETINAPARVAGMIVKREWKFEILDIQALYQHNPLACLIEPNNQVIKGLIRGGIRSMPGLRIYEDTTTTVRT
jgi:hypothetical protein